MYEFNFRLDLRSPLPKNSKLSLFGSIIVSLPFEIFSPISDKYFLKILLIIFYTFRYMNTYHYMKFWNI